jgi:Skp family chaperone for outer membrane proteins
VRTFLLPIAIAAVSVVGSASSAEAQNPAGANASKHGVAVVDISYIFKKHDRFRTTMESMKGEMEATEAELKGDRDKIAQLEQRRNTYNAGSAEYKQIDEDLARQMADFNLKMTRLRKEFLEGLLPNLSRSQRRREVLRHATTHRLGDSL